MYYLQSESNPSMIMPRGMILANHVISHRDVQRPRGQHALFAERTQAAILRKERIDTFRIEDVTTW